MVEDDSKKDDFPTLGAASATATGSTWGAPAWGAPVAWGANAPKAKAPAKKSTAANKAVAKPAAPVAAEVKPIVAEPKPAEIKPAPAPIAKPVPAVAETKPAVAAPVPETKPVEAGAKVEGKTEDGKPAEVVEDRWATPTVSVAPKKPHPQRIIRNVHIPGKALTLLQLPDEIKLHIFSFLGRKDLLRATRVCEDFENLALDSSFWVREELFCYFTKATFLEEILGVGVIIEKYPKSEIISNVWCNFDLLSYNAFEGEKVRKTVWKTPFTHFMPIYISERHGRWAIPLAKRMICKIMTGGEEGFRPVMAAELLGKMMNTMIVDLMDKEMWASEKAMEGYFACHHMLLRFVEEYPELLAWAENRIANFIKSEDYRIKKVVPSLGEFIPLLTITDKYQWEDIREPLLLEVFDRNAKWVLKKYPALGNMKSGSTHIIDKYRLLKTFEANQVSLKLLMFHVYFLNIIAKPKGQSVHEVRRVYDSLYGRPTQKMKRALQTATKEFQMVQTWVEFFARIDFPNPPSPEKLTRWLRDSVFNSSRKRYHNKWDFADAVRNTGKKKKGLVFDSATEAATDYDKYSDYENGDKYKGDGKGRKDDYW
eukprot:TRINITY_DN243_c0_g1_i5.p1 TRINITY_DN243_c0_g1~~TRINITY_DN243_c0_g1_i5.p1  ORF type:complete len:596 (+),score=162.26 TRINITY_DN243_c0_g1_i5:1229-3016(+)